jgi:hypothetical protein
MYEYFWYRSTVCYLGPGQWLRNIGSPACWWTLVSILVFRYHIFSIYIKFATQKDCSNIIHSWASASRRMLLASTFRHPATQSGTGLGSLKCMIVPAVALKGIAHISDIVLISVGSKSLLRPVPVWIGGSKTAVRSIHGISYPVFSLRVLIAMAASNFLKLLLRCSCETYCFSSIILRFRAVPYV